MKYMEREKERERKGFSKKTSCRNTILELILEKQIAVVRLQCSGPVCIKC
jgi:hypothetical protein